jgi:hypothetical protein
MKYIQPVSRIGLGVDIAIKELVRLRVENQEELMTTLRISAREHSCHYAMTRGKRSRGVRRRT